MAVNIKVPTVGESITEVVIGEWLKAPGTWVAMDESVVSLETDKVNVEVPAPVAGILGQPLKNQGETAGIGDILATIEESAQPAAAAPAAPAAASAPVTAPAPVAAPVAATDATVMPAARRVLAEAGVDALLARGTGPGGRVLKEDAQRAVAEKAAGTLSAGTAIPLVYAAPPTPATPVAAKPAPVPAPAAPVAAGDRRVEVVAMTPLRRRVAQRLVEAQHTAAILTTFNEVDMTAIQDLRKKHQEAFVAKHGIKIGFMSFFIKASVAALKEFPGVNAQLRGTDILYQHFYDIGVAVGGGKGLVVPILRDVDKLGLAGIEKALADYGARAKAGTLKLDELTGGTFSISNGGVYGSMMSTPILNPPQSAILGMHNIIERPIGLNGQVVLRPMMYLALSYDHRLIDGREAVSFLVSLKRSLEAPERLLLDI